MVAIAENSRVPVDNPATHLELTMVHEAMVLEYSGRHLALIELAAMLKLLLYASLIACLFMPWGLSAEFSASAYAEGFAGYLIKLAVARLSARGVRDLDCENARLPRAGISWRRADARAPRGAPSFRVEELLMRGLDFDIAHLLAGLLLLVSFISFIRTG